MTVLSSRWLHVTPLSRDRFDEDVCLEARAVRLGRSLARIITLILMPALVERVRERYGR